MLFHRRFLTYTGGHGKVWDYFRHALALGWDARVYLSADSLRDASNPWMTMPERIVAQWRPQEADVLFLAGMDWQAVERCTSLPPVVNLIQGVRHADQDASLPLRTFLSRPAWRICVSPQVAAAIAATGEVNGPVRVIPGALDMPPVEAQVGHGVFIDATKQRVLGAELAGALRQMAWAVDVVETAVPRSRYLARMASASVAVLLPSAREGLYLPGLECMALGTVLVMPAAEGNLVYARDGDNCLMPLAQVQPLLHAVSMLSDPALGERLRVAGRSTAQAHSPIAERAAFAALLQEMETTCP